MAIEQQDWECLKELMNANFEQRRKLYTGNYRKKLIQNLKKKITKNALDHCMGGENLKMIAIARQYGAAAKFSGSGGAIVGLLLDESKKMKMAESFQKNGFVCIGIVPNHTL